MPPRVLHVVALAAMAVALAGCGAKSEPTGSVAAFPVQAVDAAGDAVSVPAVPTRIVSADPGATHVLTDLGLGAAVVETTPAAAAARAAESGTSLVIVPLAIADDDLARISEATAAPVFRYGADPLDQAPVTIAQLGLAVGRGPEAAAIARAVADGLAAVRRSLDGRPRVRTLVEGAGLTAYGPSSPAGVDVAAAGGENVVAADQPVDPKGIASLAVAAWVALDPGGSALTRLRGFPELRQVPAIRDGRWLEIPRDGLPIDAALPAALRQLADGLQAPPVALG